MYQARDVMTRMVTTVSPDATVEAAIRLLLERRIGGAPVVDARGVLLGMISEFQLLETLFDPQVRREPVRALMSTELIAVTEEALLADVASLFMRHRIRRVPVLRDGVLVGLITRSDLLHYVLEAGDQLDAFLQEVQSFALADQRPAAATAP